MATPNPFLTDWVRNACSMEMGLVSLLEEQTSAKENDAQLRRGLDRHLQATRQHVELLQGCLRRMGDQTATLQPSNPIERIYGQMDGDGVDPTLRTELLDFVTENFEAATYKAICTLALSLGDQETARVCQQILKDETAIARALDDMLPISGVENGGVWTTERENVRIARASFDAVNAHDWKTLEHNEDQRLQVETAGSVGLLDRQEYHDYLRNTWTAFPDLHFQIERMVSEDATVVVNWTCTGTHSGRFRAPDGSQAPATNRRIKVRGSSSLDFQEGKCLRAMSFWDNLALMSQLGITQRS